MKFGFRNSTFPYYIHIHVAHTKQFADSQIDPNCIEKKHLLLEINTITKFLLFKMKYVTDENFLFDI